MKLFPLEYFKGKTKSNKGLIPEKELLYDSAFFAHKAESLKITHLD